MKNPIKIIHKIKNNNKRIQYNIYIYIGELIDESLLTILKYIEDKDLLTTFTILSIKELKQLETYYGEKWYEFFFTSYHINFQINNLKNNNSIKKTLELKFGKEWVIKFLNEPVIKKVSYSYASSYYNYLLMKNKIKTLTRKNEMDFRTYQTTKITDFIDNTTKQDIDPKLLEQLGGNIHNLNNQSGGKNTVSSKQKTMFMGKKYNYNLNNISDDDELIDDVDKDILEDDVDISEDDVDISEDDVDKDIPDDDDVDKDISEDDLDEEIEADFDLDELTKMYASYDLESNTQAKETAKLINDAVNDKKWEKTTEKLTKAYDDSQDNLNYDSKLEEIYKKVYITSQYIFMDDTIKTIRSKISVSIPMNPKFDKKMKLLPEAQYFWSEYTHEGKIDQVMLGQKYVRRNELLKIDIIPNDNLKVYEKLRNNLGYLRDSFGYKIKREDDETNVLDFYEKFINNNEIFMLDIYNDFGLNYNPEPEDKKNLYEVYINIYFPGITYERMENIIAFLNGKNNKEIQHIDNVFGSIRNDIKLETEIYKNVEKAKMELSDYEKYFFQNHIIQSIIHVNIYDPKNITGTTSDTKINSYRIFDNFVVNKDYPFIQYQAHDSNITYKLYSKTEKIDNTDVMSKWFENTPYGISVKIRLSTSSKNNIIIDDKIISINIHETGRIEYKITFKEADEATIEDIYKTYDIVRDLLKKINSENKKIKFILPPDDRFKFAFINTIQKFTIPEKFKINHNDLSEFARFFFPYVSLVIEPKKRESKKVELKDALKEETSKYGTYLRYKRISKYDNRTKMHLRILYFSRNYEFNDRELIDEVAKQFNITIETAAKELDFVREKYIKVIKKSKKLLKNFKSLPSSKPPGIDISIQGRDREKYKIRITGARDKNQLNEIISFMKVLIYLYCETYLYKKKEYQKFKDVLKTLNKIAKRRNKVVEIVDYETSIKNVKIITSLDKKRLGYKPEEGQNQWTRNCQNSGNDKKRRPGIIQGDQIDDLIKTGYKLNEKNGFYERLVDIKTKGKVEKVVIRAIKLTGEGGKHNYFTCNPDENKEHMYVGFLTKGNNPNDLCMPCCFKKDQLNSNNKFKMSYYKKCIGEKATIIDDNKIESSSIGDKIYILQETNKIQDGRFIYLPKYLDIFFNQIWKNDHKIKNHYLLESKSGYFFKYTIKHDKYNFLATMADIYQININELKNKMIEFIKNDKNENYFLFLNNGDIRELFSTREKLIDFIETSNYLEYDITGELLGIPGLLSKNGIYYYVLEKHTFLIKKSLEKEKTKDKYYMTCLNIENDYMLNENRDVVILIKEGRYYFPIYKVQKDEKKDKKINLSRFFTNTDSLMSKIIFEITSYYNKSCQNKLLNKVTISNDLCCKNILLDLDKINIKVKKLIIDNRNKCKYIEIEEHFLIPVKPSGSHFKYDFIFLEEISKLKSLVGVIKMLESLVKKSDDLKKKDFIPRTVFYDAQKGETYKIISLLLHNDLIIPLKNEYLQDKEIKKLGLTLRFQPLEEDIDKEIIKNEIVIDDRTYRVKNRIFHLEGYNIYRLELSYFLERNEDIKDKIIGIVRNKKTDLLDKKYELRKLLFNIIDKKIISTFGLSGGGKNLTIAHYVKKLPKLDDYIIYNVRDYCEVNNTKDKCLSNRHCAWEKDDCKMIINDTMAADYVNRVIEEIIQDGIKFKELLQEGSYYVSDIVDSTQFSNRPDQKIIKSSNFNINKIMNEIFGKDKAPVIGKRHLLFKTGQVIDEDYPELIELGNQLIQEVEPNKDSIIKAFVNCFYWINNSLYDNESRNLGYTSHIQILITNLFKAYIIDFIQNNKNNHDINKYLINYFKDNENFFESTVNKFRKSSVNTDGKVELFILSHLIDLPIVVYDNFSNVKYIFLQGEIKVSNESIKNFTKDSKLSKTVFLKFDFDGFNKIPKIISSIYYK